MKLSNYIYLKKIKNNYYLVDLRNNRIYEIDKNRYDNIKDEKLNNMDIEFLISKDLLVEYDVEEFQVELNRFNTIITNNKRLELVILVTSNCNFKCIYCYEDYSKFKLDSDNIDYIKTFINDMLESKRYNSIFINWFGGEPLLEFENIEKLSNIIKTLCFEKGIPYVSSITTNGYNLSLSNFKKLLRLNVRYFQVTIDGDKESHNKSRPLKNGNDTFDNIMKNMINIKNAKLKNFFSMNIRCNITKKTINNYYKLENRFKDIFLDDNRFKLTPFLVGDFGGNLVKGIKKELMNNYDMIEISGEANYNNIFDTTVQEEICYVWKSGGFTIVPNKGVFKCSHFIEKNSEFYNVNYLFDFKSVDYSKIEAIESMIIKNNHADKCSGCIYMPFCYINTCPVKQQYKFNEHCKEVIKSMLDFEIEKKVRSAINERI